MRDSAATLSSSFRRLIAVLAIVLMAACGGGSSGGSAVSDIPVRMTLTATPVDAGTVYVSWSGLSSAPTRYELYVDGSYYYNVVPSSASAVTGSARVSGFAPGTRHCFFVYAVNFPLGIESRSNEACASTFADAPPAAPTSLTAVAVTPARIDLAWTAASDDWGVAQYRVMRDGALLSTATGVTATDASPDPATTYCYTVIAVDTGGNASPASAPACATTPVDRQPPTAPTYLSAVASGAVVTLTWNASSDDGAVARYRIVRDGTALRDVPAEPGVTPVQATDSGLAASTQYCYEVIAFDRADNASPVSNRACTTTSWALGMVLPSPPMGYLGDLNALAIDVSGTLHIAYSYTEYDPVLRAYAPRELRYLGGAGGSGSPGITVHPAISDVAPAIATAGATPHVAFVERINSFPYYALIGAPSLVELVSLDRADGTGIALDAGGVPHLVYGGQELRYAVRPAGAWNVTSVPGSGPAGKPSLALDAAGHAHVAYAPPTGTDVRYATNATGAWTVVAAVNGGAGLVYTPVLAIDGAGAAHIVYYDGAASALAYATNRGGAWTSMPIDVTGGAVVSIAAVVDGAGAMHVSYVDVERGRLKYASSRGGAWRSFDLDAAGTGLAGWASTSIAIDTHARIAIAYFRDGLRLATAP